MTVEHNPQALSGHAGKQQTNRFAERRGRFFGAICDLERLRGAWEAVRKKRSAGGIDEVEVDDFAKSAGRELVKLQDELRSGRYVPEPAERVYARKSSGGHRPLGLSCVRDKIVQRAIVDVIQPSIDRRLLDCSYAYRAGKGHRKAIKRVNHHLASGLRWVATCDIDSFFDTLDQDLLMNQVRKYVWEPEVLRLIQLFLQIGAVGGRGYEETARGVGQGNVLSPLLSNVYLHPFDLALRRRKLVHVRYADDYVILCRTRLDAERAHDAAADYLQNELKLLIERVAGQNALAAGWLCLSGSPIQRRSPRHGA